MEKLNTIFSPRKLFLWILIIVLAITLPSINKPALSETDAIVTMLTVERVEGKIKTAVNILAPSNSKQSKYNVYYADGNTLGEAIEQLSIALGKDMGFSQCEIMAIGDNLCAEGVMQVLDFMTRTKKVGRNTTLVNFTGDIKEFCQIVKAVAEEKSIKLGDVINFDARYLLAEDSNLNKFVVGYYNPNSISIMPHISVLQEQKGNALEVGGAVEDDRQTNTKLQTKKFIINDGSMSVFRRGIKVLEIEPENVKKINYFANNSQRGAITVEHVTDNVYNDATVVVSVNNKDISIKPEFKDGTPIYKAKLVLTILVDEDKENFPKEDSLVIGQKYLSDKLVEKVKETVENEMYEICEYCKQHQVDLIDAYVSFKAYKNKEFKEYLSSHNTINYLQDFDFNFEVQVNTEY